MGTSVGRVSERTEVDRSVDRRDRSRAEGGTHTNTDAIGDKTMIMIAPSARRSFANALASRALPLQSDDDVLRSAVAPS